MIASFAVKLRYAGAIHWSRRGSCGNPGCADPECCCAFCRKPIGVPEDDPRWENHPADDCFDTDCELCRDQVPLIMFRGEGEQMEQAQFHTKCAEKVLHFRSGCAAASGGSS